jgi:hypothetical protein
MKSISITSDENGSWIIFSPNFTESLVPYLQENKIVGSFKRRVLNEDDSLQTSSHKEEIFPVIESYLKLRGLNYETSMDSFEVSG